MGFDPNSLGRLSVTEEQIALMDAAERVCADRWSMSKTRKYLTDETGFDPALWQEVTKLGWLGIAVPEAQGGVGLGLSEVVPVMEQMGRGLLALPFALTSCAAQAVLAGGTQAQKASLLPRFTEGAIGTMALSELNNAFDLTKIDATALQTPDGYALSGRKIVVQNLDAAKIVIVSAMLDGEISLFAFDTDLIPKPALRRETLIDESRRGYELTLDGIIVPLSARLEDAAAALQQIELTASLLGAAEQVGATKACLDYTLDYLRTRTQFGRAIGTYQALKHPMVDIYVAYEKARSLLYAAAANPTEVPIRMAAIAAQRALAFASDRSIQFHGGFGFTHDCDAQLYRRHALFHASQFGDVRWHKAKLAKAFFHA